ncbi:MAG: hypothetical protein JWP61_2605 [Friedmanniella sp.]|nr:hypothetical protein [Friedmanniella sp.]
MEDETVKQHAQGPGTSHRWSRVTRIGLPLALAAFAGTGLVAAAAPHDPSVAGPSVSVSSPADLSSRVEPNSRGLTTVRPSLTATKAQLARQAKAEKVAAAKKKAAAATAARARRVAAERAALAKLPLTVAGTRYTTAALKVRVLPEKAARSTSIAAAGSKLSVTRVVRSGYRLVAVHGQRRWVTEAYLTSKKPAAETVTTKKAATSGSADGLSSAACATGSGMESGLTSDAVKVHRALCALFPQVKAFGGLRGGEGFHSSGRAVDAMISSSSVGWEMAHWLRAHARQLGISEVIYSQKIWTVQRGGEGWRSMSDRGSATANHYDHVHISVYGSAATS